MNLMLGCDPEFFLADVNGQLKSAIDKVGGTKAHPMPLPLGPGFAVQEDNVTVEFNIPPAQAKQEFVDSIKATLSFLSDTLSESYGLTPIKLSAVSFPSDQLLDPRAQEFGCEPDFNAWTMMKNPRPSAEDKNLRSCGGHIHIGYDKKLVVPERIIRNMDLFLGIPSVLMDNGELRKQLYGKAGAYREKVYGVEYRTLSNYWIFDEELIGWAWDNTLRAVEAAVAQPVLQEQDHKLVQDCINNNDKLLAEMLVHKYKLNTLRVN
jgi:hypothetical protein